MRILFVGMSDSVHLARWISQLAGTGWDIHLFPCQWPSSVHPLLRNLTLHGVGWFRPVGLHETVKTPMPWWLPADGSFRANQLCTLYNPARMSPVRQLSNVIRRLQPDIVHTLEMQHSAYLMKEALQHGRLECHRWLYSSWGSDIYYFRNVYEHEARIRGVLSSCQFLMTDCERDVRLARDYGFNGIPVGVFPGPGGFPLSAMRRLGPDQLPSKRRLIMVKGQENWAGRALNALVTLQRCADPLAGYEIVVYYTTDVVHAVVKHMQRTTTLNITALPGPQPHDEIVRLMGRARIALGVAVSDGVPNAMLEAMVMGAFPIQSDTGAIAEWIDDGRNGLMVQPEDVAGMEAALRRALSDDALVDSAAVINRGLTNERIDESLVTPKVIEAYERVMRSAGDKGMLRS
jgi:glycosyltransferase involved in cell wall biosynthesis